MQPNISSMIILPFCLEPVQVECTITLWLWRIIPPILLVLGTSGNILNLVVLTRRRMRAHSTTIYLLFLAVSDITVLWVSLLRHALLRIKGTDVKDWAPFNCVVHEWFSYTAGGFSIWLLVLLTIERTLFTVWPVFARERITRKRTILAILTLLLLLCLFTGKLLFGFELKTLDTEENIINATYTNIYRIRTVSVCTTKTTEFKKFLTGTWRILVMLVLNIFPMIAVVIGNTTIAITLLLQKRKRRNRVSPETQRSTILDEKRNSAAKMLFFLCSFFMFTTLPFSVFNVLKGTVFSNVVGNDYAKLQLVQAITHILLYCNYTFNFFLYFVSGSLFKQEWTKMMIQVKNGYSAVVDWVAGFGIKEVTETTTMSQH